MLGLLVALIVTFGLGKLAMVGVAAVAALLLYEHTLVRHDDLSKLNAAFFTMNGVISVVFFLSWPEICCCALVPQFASVLRTLTWVRTLGLVPWKVLARRSVTRPRLTPRRRA